MDEDEKVERRKWCPTCEWFFKDFGLNNCQLVDWAINPLGGSKEVNHWLYYNSDSSTRIHPDADNCPGWALALDLIRSDYNEKKSKLK